MRVVILFRPLDGPDSTEEEAAAAQLPVIRDRAAVQRGDLIIGRYSVLPFYEALVADIEARGAVLVNSLAEHAFIADVMAWAPILGDDLTPRTWDRLEDLPGDGSAFIVKGQTNSRKDRWTATCSRRRGARLPPSRRGCRRMGSSERSASTIEDMSLLGGS